VARLSAIQQQRVDDIQAFQRAVERVRHLIAEIDGSRAASAAVINSLFATVERELSQLRERARGSTIGAIGDRAGELAVLAGRPTGLQIRVRGLTEGIDGLEHELDIALKRALTPERPATPQDQPPS